MGMLIHILRGRVTKLSLNCRHALILKVNADRLLGLCLLNLNIIDFRIVFLLLFEEFYFVKRYGTLAIDPLAVDEVIVSQIDHFAHAANVAVGHETEPAWFLRPLFLNYHAVI